MNEVLLHVPGFFNSASEPPDAAVSTDSVPVPDGVEPPTPKSSCAISLTSSESKAYFTASSSYVWMCAFLPRDACAGAGAVVVFRTFFRDIP